ncbi:hypothetical protein J3A83DRAFT_4209451 [Scleroderma citrinum]
MILFFVALSAEWWHPGDLVSWITIGIATFFVFILVAWCIWTARDRSQHWWFEADPSRVALVDDQPEDRDGCDGEVAPHALLTKRIARFISSFFNTRNRCRSVESNNEPVQEVGMHLSVMAPTGHRSLDAPDDSSRTSRQHESADNRTSCPVAINIRQATLLSDDICTPLPRSSADVTSVQ